MILWRGRLRTVSEACTLAVKEQSLGNFQAAGDVYDLILSRVRDSAEIYNNRGVVLQLTKRYEDALASYDQAINLKPDYANAHFNRGLTLKQLNRHDEALASYDRAIALKPGDAEFHNNRGVLLQQMRRHDDAVLSYDKAIAARPGHAMAYLNRGTVLANKGDMREAEKMFCKAFQLKPDFPDPLFNLTNLHRYQNVINPEANNIRALLNKSNIPPDQKEHLYFALGKIYDDCDLYDEAFEYYQQANQIRNTFISYSSNRTTKLTGDVLEVFSQDFLAGRFPFASDSRLPILIVGMPRSGTTLLANILSNHHAIATAGELSLIADFTSHLGQDTNNAVPYPQAARQMTSAAATRLINEYDRRLRRDIGPNISHVIDKNPLNFRHLGLISMLFPKVHVIHCLRDPLDIGLSNYFQRFPLSLDYSFDLRNIGHFYLEYVRLMEHWRGIPGLKMIEIGYEDMVSNTEKTVRKMLDFLELEWDERCLAPHTNPCPVETASQWQVRQPIYTRSLHRWRRYEKNLAPLIEMLLPAEPLPV